MSAPLHVGEYEWEPVRGLPETLPAGEAILWQGAPSWRGLARRALHVRKVAVYFAVLVAWRVASGLVGSEPAAQTALGSAGLVALAGLALGILAGLAWLNARATVYTITNRRVVIRCGVALTLAINLPFEAIESAGIRAYADGTGDIPLRIGGADRLGFLMLWPHVRPWGFGRDLQPMLRAVPDAREVASTLVRALAAEAEPGPSKATVRVARGHALRPRPATAAV